MRLFGEGPCKNNIRGAPDTGVEELQDLRSGREASGHVPPCITNHARTNKITLPLSFGRTLFFRVLFS